MSMIFIFHVKLPVFVYWKYVVRLPTNNISHSEFSLIDDQYFGEVKESGTTKESLDSDEKDPGALFNFYFYRMLRLLNFHFKTAGDSFIEDQFFGNSTGSNLPFKPEDLEIHQSTVIFP